MRITGRKKDLIITSSGKNITPANIESALRETRWISEAVVYGDERPYLVALVTLDRDEAAKLAAQLGIAPRPRRDGAPTRASTTRSEATSTRSTRASPASSRSSALRSSTTISPRRAASSRRR